MRIGIIGPGNLKKYCTKTAIDETDYIKIVKRLAISFAKSGNEIVVTPDKGSTSEFFAQEYLRANGKRVLEIVPLDDKEFGYEWVNTQLGENINCGTWRNQPEKLCETSELLICIGWGGGTLVEIYYTRWFGKARIYVVEELIDKPLPLSLNDSLSVEYIKASELEKKSKKGNYNNEI